MNLDYITPQEKEDLIKDITKGIKVPKDGISPKVDDIVQKVLFKLQGTNTNLSDIQGVGFLVDRLRAGGFRGGGDTITAGDNISITVNGLGQKVIASTGGGGTPGGDDTQVQFNDAGSFGGDSNFTWDKNLFTLSIGLTNPSVVVLNGTLTGVPGTALSDAGGDLNIYSGSAFSTGDAGDLSIVSGGAVLSGTGGNININAGSGGTASGIGGSVNIFAGTGPNDDGGTTTIQGGDTSGGGDSGDVIIVGGNNGGNITVLGAAGGGGTINITAAHDVNTGVAGYLNLTAGNASSNNQNGGDITFQVGSKNGSGVDGRFIFAPKGTANNANGILDFDSIATTDKTFTFPNASGTVALSSTSAYASSWDGSTSAPTQNAIYDANFYNQEYARIFNALGSAIVAFTSGDINLNSGTALTDGQAEYTAIWLSKDQTLTGVKWFQSVAGNYTADNNNYLALYTYSGGTMTRVAISTNNGNIWKATSGTFSSAAFASPYAATAGLYFIGIVWNASATTTAPQLGVTVGLLTNAAASFDFTNSAKLYSTIAAQTTLPTSQAMSGTSGTNVGRWFGLY